ncbi:hypothetical protein GCM10027403_19350 [Arthrobacter tecti]
MSGSESIDRYLHRLGSTAPTPGAGAVGALHVAQAAALVGMVAGFSERDNDDVAGIVAEARELTRAAVEAAESDEEKFRRVVGCYKLPSGSGEERARRSAAIDEALVEATLPARAQLDLAAAVVRLCEELVDVCKPDFLSDIAVAAEAARAAAATARIVVEANLSSMDEDVIRESLREHTRKASGVMQSAEELSALVRRRVIR